MVKFPAAVMMTIHFVTIITTATSLCTIQAPEESITKGTRLVSTFLIHRHGDRTPTKPALKYSTNIKALKAASAKYGYGQLTDVGKQRSYRLGQFIRARYDELLSPQYNSSEIYIRSTDFTRTKMTVLTAMAAVYLAYPGSWSKEVNWVPTPYTTVPIKYDINAPWKNCPVYMASDAAVMKADHPRMSEFFDLLNIVSEQTGYNITATPALVFIAYDVFVSQQSLGVCVSDTIRAILPDIRAAADVAIDIIFGDEKRLPLAVGPLLDEFFTYTGKQMSGANTPRVRVYSSHDSNVYSLMVAAQVTPRQGVPKYNSAFALELRLVEDTGEYVILPVYLPAPGEELVYLHVSGCEELLCPYDTFKDIVSPYILDEHTWRTQCGFTEDLLIDESSVE